MNKDVHDSYVAEHIHQALASDPRVNEPELHVHVVAGRAVITGDVPTDARKAAIDEVVRELHPDLGVDNQTSVIGTTAAGPSVERIEKGVA
jgi:osmotically-inducible protein OsmY